MRAAYRVPGRVMRPLIRLLSSFQVTDEIPRPLTRAVNEALAHPARMPVSLAFAGADR
jgi:type III secretion system FlhB-like substrate exporter